MSQVHDQRSYDNRSPILPKYFKRKSAKLDIFLKIVIGWIPDFFSIAIAMYIYTFLRLEKFNFRVVSFGVTNYVNFANKFVLLCTVCKVYDILQEET